LSIRVLIADDEAVVRTGLRMILESEDDIEVVAEAEDGLSAVERAGLTRPDVALMDIRMPHVDGIAACRRLLGEGNLPTRVLILTTFGDDQNVYEALRAGASGFLLKHGPADQLILGIRLVASGEALLSPSVTKRLIERFAGRPVPGAARGAELGDLTDREVEVLRLVAEGLSNSEIAERLVVSEATVKTHVTHILRKAGLRDRTQAVVLAYEAGLVEPGAPGLL
jgi:DNA-binding NarL/FixJ family response regulator